MSGLAYLDRMIADGYGQALTVGAFSTGIVGGGAGTILDLDQPELVIGVPGGFVLRPIFAEFVVGPGVTTADSDETEALLAVDSLGLWSGDGTYTFEEPSNMNSSFPKGSSARVGSAFTADMTTTPRNGLTPADPVLDMELSRNQEITDFNAAATSIAFHTVVLRYTPAYPEWVEGPASLIGYWGGTIATLGSFGVVRWVEAPRDIMRKYMKGEL